MQTDKSAKEVADYIAQMARELAYIADSAQLDLITYFLKMAEWEAAQTYARLHDESHPL